MYSPLKKNVSFNFSNNITYYTYSSIDYDRSPIDHVLYRRSYNRISDEEMNAIYVNLDLYKLYSMPVHTDSLHNNNYHIREYLRYNQ